MDKTKTIPDAYHLAVDVAGLIMEHSYRRGEEYRIQDILLFGSALDATTESHDLDMLVIHTLPPLTEYGVVTRYNHQQHTVEPDLDAQWSRSPPSASSILLDMGSRQILNLFDKKYDMRKKIQQYLHQLLSTLCHDSHASSDKSREQSHKESLDLGNGIIISLDGLNYDAPNQDDLLNNYRSNSSLLLGRLDSAFETIEKETVLAKVTEHLRSKGLTIDETVDMHCMTTGILSQPDDFYVRQRAIAIRQSKDPRFWPDILSAGRLYHPETKEFDIPLEQKYPGAVTLFTS